MKFGSKLTVALLALALITKANAQQTAVIINLSEQAAYLVEDGRAVLISPIASGKEGRGTPSGTFRIISKDLNHQSGSFGLVMDPLGESSTQTRPRPHTSRQVVTTSPLRCRTSWNSANMLGCMQDTCLATRHHTGVSGCPKTLLPSSLPRCRWAPR